MSIPSNLNVRTYCPYPKFHPLNFHVISPELKTDFSVAVPWLCKRYSSNLDCDTFPHVGNIIIFALTFYFNARYTKLCESCKTYLNNS